MGFRIYNNQLVDNNKKKNKYIKLINANGEVLHTYQVDNFDNCYIPNQDSDIVSYNYIINGNLYTNTNDLIDSSGLCTCCDSKISYIWSVFIKDGKLYRFRISTNREVFQLTASNPVKVCGKDSDGTDVMPIVLHSDGTISYVKKTGALTTTSISNVVDICGQFSTAIGWNAYGYYLTSSGSLYGGKGTGISKLASNVKKIYCSGNGDGRHGYSFISNDDTWYIIQSSIPNLKVSQVTPGPYIKQPIAYLYGISLEDSSLYCVECNITYSNIGSRKVTQIGSSGWTSICATWANTGALGIKDGKVYKIVGKDIQELPNLGNNNIKLDGVDRFLLYCEE